MNLLSSLLKYTADQIAALRAKDSSQDSTVSGINTRLITAEGDIDSLEAQFTTVVSAVTTDTEVTNIRVGDDGVTYDTAGNAVRKQFSDVKSALDGITLNEVEDLTTWEVGGLVPTTGAETTTVTNRIRTDYIDSKTAIKSLSGFQYMIYAYRNVTSSPQYVGAWNGSQLTTSGIWLSNLKVLSSISDSYSYRIVLKAVPDKTMAPSDGQNLITFRFTDASLITSGFPADAKATGDSIKALTNKVNNTFHGVTEMPIDWLSHTNSIYSSDALVASDNKYACSGIKEMPKTGIYIYTDNLTWIKTHFWYKDIDGGYIPATDYPYYWGDKSNPETLGTYARYYPYSEGLYFTLVAYNLSGIDVDSLSNNIHIFYGAITDNGGRLPNLSPIAMFAQHKNGVIADQSLVYYLSYGYYRMSSSDPYSNALNSRAKYYVSILRTQDVDKIVIAPPYSAVARIYKIDNDNKTLTVDDEIFAPLPNPSLSNPLTDLLCGVSVIDASKYNFDGFIVLSIVPEINEYYGATTSWYKLKSNGMLNKYTDIYNNVFVEWKAGISVTYDSGIPTIAKQNINAILNNNFAVDLKAPLADGGYGSYVDSEVVITYNDIEQTHGWWYNASNAYNVPHMNVNPKSYITASKNRHSRVYVPSFPNAPSDTKNNLYGSVCSSTAALICGRPIGIETTVVNSRLVPDLECRDYTCLEDIKAGDMIAGSSLPLDRHEYGHIVYATESVKINGETYCVNAFEGTSPWTGFRTYVNLDAIYDYDTIPYKGDASSVIGFYSSRYWDQYDNVVLARLAPRSYKAFRDAYGAYDVQDYAVTEIMCDRGSDSVYCIGEYMTLTVTDGTETIDIYRNGSYLKTVALADYSSETYSDGKVYTVTGIVDESGYYEIYANNSRKESFFVPPDRTVQVTLPNTNDCVVKFSPNEENDTVIAVEIRHYNQANPHVEMPVPYFNDIDGDTVDGNGLATFVAPRYITLFDNISRGPTDVRVLRKTPYGTYETRVGIYNGLYRQRAGLMLTAES